MTDAAPLFRQADFPARIERKLRRKLSQTTLTSGTLLTVCLLTPELTFHHSPALQPPWFLLRHPTTDHYLLGLGIAHRLTANGQGRLQRLADRFDQCSQHWLQLCDREIETKPVAFVGFAFSEDDPMQNNWQELPNAGLFFPELLFKDQGYGQRSLSFTTLATPFSDKITILKQWMRRLDQLINALDQHPKHSGRQITADAVKPHPGNEQWLQLARDAIATIQHNDTEKIVPSRRLSVTFDKPFEPANLLPILDRLYPDCTLFGLNLGHRLLTAATPERLVRRQRDQIICDAIGGTISLSGQFKQDQLLSRQLQSDPKTQAEHALVIKGIHAALKPLCTKVELPEQPAVIRLRHLQHLWTEIRGELKPGSSLLEIASHLHPTPAVNGLPSKAAKEWLAKHEPGHRGWYTGAAGWIDADGDGEIAVLLRCTLLDEQRAELFAGAGITADSNPMAELEETNLKMQTMLEALEKA